MKFLFLLLLVPFFSFSQVDSVTIRHEKMMYLEIYEGQKLLFVSQFKGIKKIPLKGVKKWRLITKPHLNYSRLYFNMLDVEDNNLDLYEAHLEEINLRHDWH